MIQRMQHCESPKQETYRVRKNIYSRDDVPVLLLKKGQAVSRELMDNLLGFGIIPRGELFEVATSPSRNIAFDEQHSPVISWNFRENVVIYEADKETRMRLISCLQKIGVPAGCIHFVFSPRFLHQVIKKYEPMIVFIGMDYFRADRFGYADESDMPDLDELIMLKTYPCLQQLIVTADITACRRTPDDIRDAVERYGVDILFKPINRFSLSALFRKFEECSQFGDSQVAEKIHVPLQGR